MAVVLTARDLTRHTMEFRDGHLHLDDTPGLGVTLDDDVIAQYRLEILKKHNQQWKIFFTYSIQSM